MTLIRDKNLQTGIAGSLAIHAVLLLLIAWGVGMKALTQWHQQRLETMKLQREVTLLFPDQLLLPEPPPPPPPPPKPELKPYIRTTQNEGAAQPPASSTFTSDRNTVAMAKIAPSPDATVNMPTTQGISQRTSELANRDYRDGQIKNDRAEKAPLLPPMLAPETNAPPNLVPPEPARPDPEPAPTPATAPVQVAKVELEKNATAMKAEDLDKEAVRVEITPRPHETREPKDSLAEDSAPQKPRPAPAPPKEVKPASMPDPESKSARPPEDDSFSPLTRTSTVRGTISNRGSEDAVDAERTPLGSYMRGVTSSVEKKWHLYRMLKKDAVTYGSLRVRFFVQKNGRVEDLKIISDPRDADPRLADFTLRAIKDAEIPPIPADLLPLLEGERVKIEYDVLIY